MSTVTRITTTCTRDCPNTCGLVATVQDGRLVKLAGDPAHPLTRGVSCVKAARYVARVYSPERVTRPLVRVRGRWTPATWDQALDLVAENLQRVCAESGPEAVLYYQGYGERTALKLLNRYFFNLLGGVTTLRGSLCGGTGQASQNLDVGDRVSHDPLDHANSASMVLWARNPASTNVSLVRIIRELRRRGGPVILVDPAPSKSAGLADHRIAPRPGGDAFLAMAAAKLILAAGAEDREFLAQHSVGAEQYLRLLDRFGMEELCGLAGVPEEDAAFLADTLMRHKPTSILLGWGLHRREYAHYSIRAIDALGALSGNIGVPGGGVSQGFEEYGPYDQAWWGDGLNPPRRALLLPRIGEEILAAADPAIRMIYVTAANPVCMAPNSGRVAEAFRKAEFMVYSGHFLDDTADLAHVFLPATTFLEEDDVMASYGHNYLGPVNPAIAPVGQCKSEFAMFCELARRFPFADRYCRSVDDWLRDLCAPVWKQGRSLEELRRGAIRLDAPMVPYADRKFSTPSGKFQFLTEIATETLAGPDAAYPYRLLTVAPHGFICSERTMADHPALPEVSLAATEAARLGLADGDPVLVRSPVGQVRAVLRAREGLRPDVLVAERGGWAKAGHGLNALTRDLTSRVGAGTPYYETAVAVLPGPPRPAEGRRILVVQHSPLSPGGNFCKELERQGARLDRVRPQDGEALPASPDGYAGLVVLGGPQHAYLDGPSPHFPALLQLMRDFDASDRPVAGICLGAQILARAWGARVYGMGDLEFGYARHQLTTEGQADPVLGPAPLPELMMFHEDTFDLPAGATLLAQGEQCPHQAFRVGRLSYGFQFHLEADSATVGEWIDRFRAGRFEGYAGYLARYDEAYFRELAGRLPLLLAATEAFCRGAASRWLHLAT